MSNSEIIEKKYTEAVQGIKEEWFLNSDSSWYDYIVELPRDLKVTYLVTILHNEVFNGGFHQYFVNGYGQFAAQTIPVLIEIGALRKAELLKKALSLVNRDNATDIIFRKRLLNRSIRTLFDDDTLFDPLDQLDKEYYQCEEVEEVEVQLGRYLLNN